MPLAPREPRDHLVSPELLDLLVQSVPQDLQVLRVQQANKVYKVPRALRERPVLQVRRVIRVSGEEMSYGGLDFLGPLPGLAQQRD